MGKSIEDIFVRKRKGKRLPISRVVRFSGDCVHRYFWWHWTKWKEQKQRAFQLLRIISSYQKTARRVFSYPVVLRTPCISYSPWSASFGFVCFIWIDWVGLSRAKWTRPKKPKNRSVSYSSFGRFSSRLCAVPPLGSECVLCVCVCVYVRACELACLILFPSFVPFGNIPSTFLDNCIYYSWQFECFIMVAIVFPDFSFESCMPSTFEYPRWSFLIFSVQRVAFWLFLDFGWCYSGFVSFLLFGLFGIVLLFFIVLGALPLYVFSVYLHRIMHLKLHWLMSTDCVKHLFLVISSMHRR